MRSNLSTQNGWRRSFSRPVPQKGDSLPPVFRFSAKGPDKNTRKWLEEFFSEIGLKTIGGQEFDWNRVEVRKDKVYYQLPFPLDLRGISFLRNGLYLGDLKKNRFEPSQPLALALHKGDVEAVISLPVSDERLTRYLKGETLMIEPEEAAHKKAGIFSAWTVILLASENL